MRTIIRKRKIALGASLLVILVLFSEWTALELTKPICPDFSYQADIFSIDNFYNEEEARFYGELVSNSKFSFQVIEKKEEGFVIENSFGVTKPDGSEIFSVKRLLGSDPEGNHVSSLGDKVRVGRIFGPEKGEDEYTYWHINYDVPIQLKKVAREYIFGLAVEKYEGVIEADQTENLSYLPGVPEKRGVRVKGLLSTWIEPRTGRLIKYEDFARAWYYDVLSGENTIPWNEFHNEFQNTSVIAQVQKAQAQILLIRICQVFFPVFLLLIFTLWYFKVSSFWRQRILSSQGFFIAALIFVFGLLVTSYSFYALDKSHLREQVENTEYFSRELVNALQREIQVASEALEFMRYQFQQNDTITESQFNVQAQRLINRSTSIKGLSWLPRINNQDRKAFEKLIPSGYISAWDGSTNNKLAPVAPFYFPVYYIVPNEGNSKAIGFDVNTRPETKACIKNALLFNGIQTSAPVLI
ncbi:MAG: CHASE domain-containing protein, partial [Luteibaculum sp.]